MTALIVCVVVVGGRDRWRRRWGSILWRGGGTGRLGGGWGGGWGGGVKGEHGEGGSDKGGLEGGEEVGFPDGNGVGGGEVEVG